MKTDRHGIHRRRSSRARGWSSTGPAGLLVLIALACSGGGGGGAMTGPEPPNPPVQPPPASEAPTATIIAPADGTTVEEGDEVTLRGEGMDPEDGALGGASLRWESQIDGFLGTGGELTVADLSVGTHTITLTAIDSEGAEGTDRKTLSILRPTVAVKWVEQATGTGDILVNIVFTDPNNGRAVNQLAQNVAPLFLWTSDGGTTWNSKTVQTSDSQDIGNLFDFRDANTGFMGGQNCILLRTIDGGASWSQEKICESNLWLLTIYFLGDDVVWAGGGEGLLLRSDDGGESWEVVETGDIQVPVNAIHFLDSGTGMLATGAGIYRTTNGGETWSQQDAASVLDIAFLDGVIGVAVGWDGTVLRTTDGGVSWSAVDTGVPPNDLFGVDFGADGFGVAVGTNMILVTEDGGATWTRESSGRRQEYTGVSVLDAEHAWISGLFGTILVREP